MPGAEPSHVLRLAFLLTVNDLFLISSNDTDFLLKCWFHNLTSFDAGFCLMGYNSINALRSSSLSHLSQFDDFSIFGGVFKTVMMKNKKCNASCLTILLIY